MIEGDLSQYPGAFMARKLPIEVAVTFAESDGMIETLEGPVRVQAGDAVMTGVEGEHWPIERHRFFETYDAVPVASAALANQYIKRPMTVWALTTNTPTSIRLSKDRGLLHALSGDVIVQYEANDFAVVGAEIFQKTYEKLETPKVNSD